MRGLWRYFMIREAGSAFGSLIGVLVLLFAVAFIVAVVRYIAMVVLLVLLTILSIIASMICAAGAITATISFISALTREVKYEKSEAYAESFGLSAPKSTLLRLFDLSSIERVLSASYDLQHDLFARAFLKHRVLRRILLFSVQPFGYLSVTLLSALYFFLFGSCAFIVSMVRPIRSKPYDASQFT